MADEGTPSQPGGGEPPVQPGWSPAPPPGGAQPPGPWQPSGPQPGAGQPAPWAPAPPQPGVYQPPPGYAPPAAPTPPGYPNYQQPGAYQPPPAGYMAPGAGAQPMVAAYGAPPGAPSGRQTNGTAVMALVVSIISLGLCWYAGIIGAMMGGSAKRAIRESGGTQTGEGLASAAQVIGWLEFGLGIVAVLGFFVLVFAAGDQLKNVLCNISQGLSSPNP